MPVSLGSGNGSGTVGQVRTTAGLAWGWPRLLRAANKCQASNIRSEVTSYITNRISVI
ncbi:hypothetical protein SAMN06265337_2085 [Hymenobacter gelipurpurascens]|uniref:Uncharacterized protein n=1 Tax=Hymenobacter gelipurpurascens TaxID=89968 RepID=A0A212TPN9_9BACT|nr:hypothetical protein SAMN06265337_2085 [Hymenobacter gelipurpurascens]